MEINEIEEKIMNEEVSEQDSYKASNFENQLKAQYQGYPLSEWKRTRRRRSKSPIRPLEIDNLQSQASLLSSKETLRNDSRNKGANISVFKRPLNYLLKGRMNSENEVSKTITGQETKLRSHSDSTLQKMILKRSTTLLENISIGKKEEKERVGLFQLKSKVIQRCGPESQKFNTHHKQNTDQYTTYVPCKRLSELPTNEWKDLVGEEVMYRDTQIGGLSPAILTNIPEILEDEIQNEYIQTVTIRIADRAPTRGLPLLEVFVFNVFIPY